MNVVLLADEKGPDVNQESNETNGSSSVGASQGFTRGAMAFLMKRLLPYIKLRDTENGAVE